MRLVQYKTIRDKVNDLSILFKERSFNYEGCTKGLNAPQMIVKMMETVYHISEETEEFVYMITLNSANRPLGIFEISHGTINSSLANPREIFHKALLINSTSIILVHNHPSGETIASKEDLQISKRIQEVGNLVGIRLLDHIIIGDDYRYTSLKEEGLL